MTLKVAIHGAAGRMGKTLVRLVHEAPGMELAAAVDSAKSPLLGKDAGEVQFERAIAGFADGNRAARGRWRSRKFDDV